MTTLNNLKRAAVVSGAMLCITSAWAVPTITISDGTDTLVISDGGKYDNSATAGEVAYTGRIGSWFMDLNMVGQTTALMGSTLVPSLDLHFAAASKETGGTLKILFSEDYFGPMDGAARATLDGTTQGSVAAWAYFNQNNAISGEQSLIGSQLGAFSASQNADVHLDNPYSLTLEVNITEPDNPAEKLSSSGDLRLGVTPVPDSGATLAMLAFGLAGVAGLRRRFGRG